VHTSKSFVSAKFTLHVVRRYGGSDVPWNSAPGGSQWSV